MTWLAICNGGPNNATVGKEYKSREKACFGLEAMMRNLNADIGQVQILNPDDPDCHKVESEKDAGHTTIRDVYGNFVDSAPCRGSKTRCDPTCEIYTYCFAKGD